MSMLMRRRRLGVERCFEGSHSTAEARDHFLKHMVAPNTKPMTCYLQVGVAIAEMPGEPHQRQPRRRLDLSQLLNLTTHQYDAPVVEHDAIAVAQCHSFIKVQQELVPVLALQHDAASVAITGV